MSRTVFITGGAGYMGRALIPALMERDHEVVALARSQSVSRLPAGCRAVQGEAVIRASGMRATFPRPWYVPGSGHRWPCVLTPFYWPCERIPATRKGARRLGLVALEQMTFALVRTVESPPSHGARIVEVPEIGLAQL